MVFALCFGQPRKKRVGKLSIGRATVTANLELTTEKSPVTWTARKKAVKEKKKIAKQHQRNNHMQDASHQSNRRPGIVPQKRKALFPRSSHSSSVKRTPTRIRVRQGSCIFPAVFTVPINNDSLLRFQVSLHACVFMQRFDSAEISILDSFAYRLKHCILDRPASVLTALFCPPAGRRTCALLLLLL